MIRAASLGLFLIFWQLAASFFGPHFLPLPSAVLSALISEARSGALGLHLGATLLRVLAGFALSMIVGTVLGVAMGRFAKFDRFADPWLVIFLNLPALVIIMLAYIWAGLGEAAAIGAIALNKIPNTIVTLREGTRALDRQFDEMAQVFHLPTLTRWRQVIAPQLLPYFAAAARSGLALVWKIVLVVELIGRPNGIGFEMGVAFQLFDLKLLFAYALPFVAIMLAVETFILRPWETHLAGWRHA